MCLMFANVNTHKHHQPIQGHQFIKRHAASIIKPNELALFHEITRFDLFVVDFRLDVILNLCLILVVGIYERSTQTRKNDISFL